MLNPKSPTSLKWRMTMIGLKCVLGIYVGSLVLFGLRPEIAVHAVSLANIAVTAIGGMVGIFCGAHAAVNFAAVQKGIVRDETKRIHVISPKYFDSDSDEYREGCGL